MRDAINAGLQREIEREEGRVASAMRRALEAGGKRLRPIAVLLAGEAFRGEREQLLPYALAIEMVHTSSLILDDLPEMDDAEERRGQPALHRAVGEADAILAAFAMLARGFALAAQPAGGGRRQQELAQKLVLLLENAIGVRGMCEGQSRDLALDASHADLRSVEAIHRLKTGALFAAALEGGGRIGGAEDEALAALFLFGKNLGLAFQVRDDLLDWEGDAAVPALPLHGRPNFVALFGVEAAKEVVRDLHETARRALAPLGSRSAPLIDFATYLEVRES
ncbi:MAG: polyprenyl synthetase family protein [Planctomycetes bacterium]|nr:polyprenyl synthetase family protein [Planctomycetota bacterium]